VGAIDPTAAQVLLPELARVPGHVLWRAAARVTQALDDTLPPGVDIHGYAVLLALAAGQARSQQWLADTVSVSRTTMTKVVSTLVDQGLVERVRNPDDRRSYVLTRTPEGAATARRWRRHADELEKALGRGFDDAELAELRALLLAVVGPELSEETPDQLRESIGFLVSRLHARAHTEGLAALRPLDLEPRHTGTLIVLRTLGEIPQAELARHLGITGPSVVEIVDHLERRGLVERRRSTADRRAQLLHLLPAADQVGGEARTRLTGVVRGLLAPLDDDDRDRLVALLVRLVTGG
jgi:DNA-binding MarR family transcriptional regulator